MSEAADGIIAASTSTRNEASVIHEAQGKYCYALDRDTLCISIRTAEDVEAITLVYADPFMTGILGADTNGWKGEESEIVYKRHLRSGVLWWSIKVKPPYKRLRYFFRIKFNGINDGGNADKSVAVMGDINGKITRGEYLFCEDGFHPLSDLGTTDCILNAFVFPWMNEADICTVPSWAGDTVWYQIFPARFCRGKGSPKDGALLPWAEPSHAVTNDERYGGNLAGITEKLDYIAGLGVTGIYLTPVNAAPSQHKYDTTDYLAIDESFGTKEDMKCLVKEAHRRGIKIMLDGVFNHTGPFFYAWRDVVEKRDKSQYKDWFIINDMDFDVNDYHNANKGKYYTFAFHDGMPKLNTNNAKVRSYVCDVCEKWVRDYDIDALRLDVANEVSHKFCQVLRERLKGIKADFYIVGEIWHNALPWLEGNEFDAVMNYPLSNALLRFALSDDSARRLEEDVNRCLTSYSEQVTMVLLNQLDSHDTMRAVTRLSNREATLQCLALLFCLPGAACIYYGTEVLLEGGYDPDCRRCMPWRGIDSGEYKETIDFIKRLIQLRGEEKAMRMYDTRFMYGNGGQRVVHIVKGCGRGSVGCDIEEGSIDAFFNFGKEDEEIKVSNTKKIILFRGYDGHVLHSGGLVLFKGE